MATLSGEDRTSLQVVIAAFGRVRDFSYLQIGSMGSADAAISVVENEPQCLDATILPSDRADDLSPPRADVCLIATDPSTALTDARFCRRAIRGGGLIVFHERTRLGPAIQEFLGELDDYRAYPLAHELLVVEISMPTLLGDTKVSSRLPRREWHVLARHGLTRHALALTATLRSVGRSSGHLLLRVGAPRRRRLRPGRRQSDSVASFSVITFVTDQDAYEAMKRSFIASGFDPDTFRPLSDTDTDPYGAIRHLRDDPQPCYPILCHQDVILDRDCGATELTAVLRHLDEVDPYWIVCGVAGVTAEGLIIREYVNPQAPVPRTPEVRPVISLDECFLVFNPRIPPDCTPSLAGFHLYGTDVCLNALDAGGGAYVVNFSLTHVSDGNVDSTYRAAERALADSWSSRGRSWYIISPCGAVFASRSRLLRWLFGSRLAMWCVALVVQGR